MIFDVDGTLADTERDGHRVAFNEAFEAAGMNYRWSVEEYGELLTITGGRRRIERYLQSRGHRATEAAALATQLHRDKTRRFARWSARARSWPGQDGRADHSTAGRGCGHCGRDHWHRRLGAAIARHLFGLDAFDVVVTGSDVTDLKPDPAVYLETLVRLDLTPAVAVAVEDSANGVQAAVCAGLRCVAVVNEYTRGQDLSGAVAVLDDMARPGGISVLRGDPGGRRVDCRGVAAPDRRWGVTSIGR